MKVVLWCLALNLATLGIIGAKIDSYVPDVPPLTAQELEHVDDAPQKSKATRNGAVQKEQSEKAAVPEQPRKPDASPKAKNCTGSVEAAAESHTLMTQSVEQAFIAIHASRQWPVDWDTIDEVIAELKRIHERSLVVTERFLIADCGA